MLADNLCPALILLVRSCAKWIKQIKWWVSRIFGACCVTVRSYVCHVRMPPMRVRVSVYQALCTDTQTRSVQRADGGVERSRIDMENLARTLHRVLTLPVPGNLANLTIVICLLRIDFLAFEEDAFCRISSDDIILSRQILNCKSIGIDSISGFIYTIRSMQHRCNDLFAQSLKCSQVPYTCAWL